MKKTYLSPEVEITRVAFEQSFLDSFTGQSSANLTIVDATDEDDWEF